MSAEEVEDMEATEGGEEAYTGPLSTKLFAKRYFSMMNLFTPYD
jgi:hypothetical protein